MRTSELTELEAKTAWSAFAGLPEIEYPKKIPRAMGQLIRLYLLARGEGYPHEFWEIYRKRLGGKGSYAAVAKYFWYLQELGLIEFVRTEKGPCSPPTGVLPPAKIRPGARRIYRIAEGAGDDEGWFHPQRALAERRGWVIPSGAEWGKGSGKAAASRGD